MIPTDAELRPRSREDILRDFGGDPRRVLLDGFSRGAIACGYLGLHDDETSALWTALFAYSHFDGHQDVALSASDRASALTASSASAAARLHLRRRHQTEETEKIPPPLLPKPYDLPVHGFRNHNAPGSSAQAPPVKKAVIGFAVLFQNRESGGLGT